MSTLRFSASADDHEELARAEVYGLLSALFIAPPAAGLYSQLQVAVTEAPAPGAFLEGSFGGLVAASRRLSLAEVQEEFVALFEGTGKPEVFVYSSYFIAGSLNETPLVTLRDDLHMLGLERDPALFVTEDHLACLCETMRFLVAGDDLAVSNLATQQRFFNAHLRSWTDTFWDALEGHPRSDFYAAVAAFGRDFFSIEAQAFDMLDA